MKTPTLHQSLQAKLGAYTGEHLTAAIRYQDRYGNLVEKPLLDATLDEVAFAIQTLNAESASCLLYTSPSPRDRTRSRMPSSA